MRVQWLTSAAWLTAAAISAPATALTIDDFGTPPAGQTATVGAGGVNPASADISMGAGDALGGERDLEITRTSGLLIFSADVNSTTGGAFTHTQALDVQGSSTLSWDGVDGDATSLDTAGLGGLDLTASGLDNAFVLDVLSISAAADVVVDVYTDGIGSSTLTLPVTGAGLLILPFGAFSGTADFSDVGAIALTLDGTSDLGLTASFGSFATTAVPEPSPAPMLGMGLAVLAARGRLRAGAAGWRRAGEAASA